MVSITYKNEYDHLKKSGLYENLLKEGMLIPHKEVEKNKSFIYKGKEADAVEKNECYIILKPEEIPFISYPYEWSFSQLKDAALLTLKIQKFSLEYGMSLKDSSAYNIQFYKGKPILIDTLSFEKYCEVEPWVAYRQFCEHFLAPLVIMCYKDIHLGQLLRVYNDGIPLNIARTILPLRTLMMPSIFIHIHLHSKSQTYYSDKYRKVKKIKANKCFNKNSLLGVIFSLESAINGLKLSKSKLFYWSKYYSRDEFSDKFTNHKRKILSDYIDIIKPKKVWDLGSNIGVYSRIASSKGIFTVSIDSDPLCIEKNYIETKKNKDDYLLPIVSDITNPSPGTGWENSECLSLIERGPADTVLALSIIHHLAIGNNVPLMKIRDFFYRICTSLIVEFIPKKDPMLQKLLLLRKDIFSDYTQKNFENIFSESFKIEKSEKLKDTNRVLYLMVKK